MSLVIQRMVKGIDAFPLLAVPFFVLAGNLLAKGGIARRLINMAYVIVGGIRGGLALVTTLSSMFFGGISGSSVADVSAIGSMLIPAMTDAGYKRARATAIVLTSATVAPIIPPSIPMIIYAYVAGGVSVAGLFLAGAVPGVLIGFGLMGVSYLLARKEGFPAEKRVPLAEAWRRIVDGLLGLLTLIIIMGGILSGIFTATESGAIAVVYTLIIVLFVYREIKIRDLPEIILDTALTTSVVLFLVATSTAFSWIMTFENLPQTMTTAIFSLTQNKILILLFLNIMLFIVGMFVDLTPAVVMLVPIILPLAYKIGINPLHLGTIVVVNLTFGLITPPVGTSLFVGCSIAGIKITEVVRPMLPYFLVMLFILMLITYLPQTVLFVPRIFGFD